MKIVHYILLFIGLVGIIDACILSFTTTINNFGTWFPGIVGLLLAGLSIGKLTGKIDTIILKYQRLVNFAKVCFIIWGISFILVEGYILFPATTQKFAEPDYVVILGAGLNGDKPSLLLSERMVTAVEYLNSNKTSQVVVSGGQGPDEAVAEGAAMKTYLVQHGIKPRRIIVEDKSTTTLENFKFTRALLPQDKHKILVITSGFHIRRAIMLAERTGFIADGLPSKTPYSIAANYYLREYFALIKSYFRDK